MFEKLEFFDDDFGLSRAEFLRKLSSQLGADYGGGEIKVVRGDREYLMFMYYPERGYRVGTSYFFEIKTKIPFSHPFFAIKKSGALDWLFEHILLMPDYQVGDTDFDSKFYIKLNDVYWGRNFFCNHAIREAISELLLKDFDLIRSEDGDLKVIKFGSSYPKVEMINHGIEAMGRILSEFLTNT
jgi:hypothetical protein